MVRAALFGLSGALAAWVPGWAAPMSLELTPANMLAETHSHALVVSVTGIFRQLSGRLDYDPASGACHADVTFIVESLAFSNAMVRAQSMSPGFLDPEKYPTEHYAGTCQGNEMVGELTMHGQTHPFDMTVTPERQNGALTGLHLEGVLNRHDWGLNGLSIMVGKMIRVTNEISLDGRAPGSK